MGGNNLASNSRKYDMTAVSRGNFNSKSNNFNKYIFRIKFKKKSAVASKISKNNVFREKDTPKETEL